MRRDRRAERCGVTASAGTPAAAASSSWSRGQPGRRGSSRPVTTGLYAATRSPRARSAAAIAPATTVLPTPVSVPVTNRPRISARPALTPPAGAARRRRRRTRAAARPRRSTARPRPARSRTGGSRCAARPGRGRARRRAARPCVCDAITASRSRDVPSGTVGGRIACANTPCSSAASQIRIASPASPTISGTIWRLRARHVEALAGELVAQRRRVVGEPLDAPRLLLQQLERRHRRRDRRRRQPGGEDQRPRGVDEVARHRVVAGDERAVGAERLAERADDHVDLALEPGLGDRAAPARARACRCRARRRPSRARRGGARARRSPRAARRRRPSRTRRR